MSKPLTKKDYDLIYSKVARLTVELIIIQNEKILLTKRAYEPCVGQWHIPGGTVYFGETIEEAIHRVAKEELSIDVEMSHFIDFLFYPNLSSDYGIWPIGAAFLINNFTGDIQVDFQASEYRFFDKIPDQLIEDQKNFLKQNYEALRS